MSARQRLSVAWSPRVVLDAGAEVPGIRSSWAMQALSLVPSRSVGPDTFGRWLDYDGPIDARLARTAVGAWVQQSVPIPGVIVEPGLRVDWNTWTRETAVQPRLRVTRTIGDSSVLWAGLAWQAQTPGFETMQHGIQYYDFVGPVAADVRNEQMRQVVVGLDRRLPGAMTIRVEAYHRQFERLLVQRAETELERQQRLARYDLPPICRPTARSSNSGRRSIPKALAGVERRASKCFSIAIGDESLDGSATRWAIQSASCSDERFRSTSIGVTL